MTRALVVPPRPAYQSGSPSRAGLVERDQALRARAGEALAQVDGLVRTQREVGELLTRDLGALQHQGRALDELEREASEGGLLAGLVRRFTGRRAMLERRSATEALLGFYEAVSVDLRRASSFTDELRLCALELQDDVRQLNDELARALHDQKLSARRVLDLEALARQVERDPHDGEGAVRDTVRFELRQEAIALELFEATARVCRESLDPARALRDTVLQLYEEMSAYVVAATGAVNASGRRIQALGMAADAPLVIAELDASLGQLQQAMDATTAYVAQTRELVARTLPGLTARLDASREVDGLVLPDERGGIDRERARRLAEDTLRAEAEAEIDALLRGRP